MAIETIPFDGSEVFGSYESQIELLTRKAGVTREALNKALSETGDPKLTTLLGVVKALGVKPTVVKVVAKMSAWLFD